MENPQPLPTRATTIDLDSMEAFVSVQPERGRSSLQLQPGHFRARLRESSWGSASLQQERWECGIGVRSERATSFVTFALITQSEGRVLWNGAPLARGDLLRITEPWEVVTEGLFEFVGFCLARDALEDAEYNRFGDQDRMSVPPRSSIIRPRDPGGVATFVRRCLELLESSDLGGAALTAMEAEMIDLATRVDRAAVDDEVLRPSHPSSRRALVRRVEDYLDASRGVFPSISRLCEITGASERTLEYAFRDQRGLTPSRYLKLRRMNLVRERLRAAHSPETRVTDIALDCGFYDLGRFAGEYRSLFGELPSETLARSAGTRRRPTVDQPARR